MYLRDDDVLQIFHELPGHQGCTEQELRDVEDHLGVKFPSVYRSMMQLDATRLASAGIVVQIHQLEGYRNDAIELLIDDGHSFRLSPEHVVFAWDDIFAFYFFRAVSENDTEVLMFNYYSSDDGWQPRIKYNSLTAFFVEKLRQYLKLDQILPSP